MLGSFDFNDFNEFNDLMTKRETYIIKNPVCLSLIKSLNSLNSLRIRVPPPIRFNDFNEFNDLMGYERHILLIPSLFDTH